MHPILASTDLLSINGVVVLFAVGGAIAAFCKRADIAVCCLAVAVILIVVK